MQHEEVHGSTYRSGGYAAYLCSGTLINFLDCLYQISSPIELELQKTLLSLQSFGDKL